MKIACRHLSSVAPLREALSAAEASTYVTAIAADTAAAILAERFALPGSTGVQACDLTESAFACMLEISRHIRILEIVDRHIEVCSQTDRLHHLHCPLQLVMECFAVTCASIMCET